MQAKVGAKLIIGCAERANGGGARAGAEGGHGDDATMPALVAVLPYKPDITGSLVKGWLVFCSIHFLRSLPRKVLPYKPDTVEGFAKFSVGLKVHPACLSV
eukprot:1138735-Pelagomonas_calceolata.AAC.2